MENNSNPLLALFDLILAIFLFSIGALLLTVFINLVPTNPLSSAVISIYQSVFGFFDKSFFFIALFIIVVDVFVSYIRPSIVRGFGNILFLLGFGYIFLNVRNIVLSATSALNFNAILPYTYSTLSNNYLAIFIFFLLVIATAFNFRPNEEKKEQGSRENG